MKIGILGAGIVGTSLGQGWARAGHQVMFSSREPDSAKIHDLVRASGPGVSAGTPQATVAFGEVVVIALPGDSVEGALTSLSGWADKIVIDATNRFVLPANSAGSMGQDVARWAAGAHVVKAFNTIGAEMMQDPHFGDQHASLFLCGDHPPAKQTVAQLAATLGFEPVDCGGLAAAPHLENLAKFWVYLARSTGNRSLGFKLLRK